MTALSSPQTAWRALSLVRHARAGAVLVALLMATVVWGAIASPYFLTSYNLFNSILNLVVLGLLCLALVPVIVTGEIDVSVQGMLSLGAATTGLLYSHHLNTIVVLLGVLLLGAVGGTLNAIFVTRFGLPSLVVTLGSLTLYQGLAFVELGQNVIGAFPAHLVSLANGALLDLWLPTLAVFFLVAALALAVVLHWTRHGRRLFFIGKNARAARYSGIDVAGYKAATFVFAGIVSALAGAVLAVQYSSARGDSGAGLLLPALTAVLLARVDVAGGKGNTLAVVAALFFVSAMLNVQILLGWGPEIGQITIGTLLVLSVAGPGLLGTLGELSRGMRPPGSSNGPGLRPPVPGPDSVS